MSTSDYEWASGNPDLVVKPQAAIAVYENHTGAIVLRQERDSFWQDEDPFIVILPANALALAAAILKAAGPEDRAECLLDDEVDAVATATVPTSKAAQRSRVYRARKRHAKRENQGDARDGQSVTAPVMRHSDSVAEDVTCHAAERDRFDLKTWKSSLLEDVTGWWPLRKSIRRSLRRSSTASPARPALAGSTVMADVVPFPYARRRSFIRRQAAFIGSYRDDVAEKHLRQSLRVQRDTMDRRGVAPERAAAELRALETAIRVELWRLVLCRGGAA